MIAGLHDKSMFCFVRNHLAMVLEVSIILTPVGKSDKNWE